MGPTDVAIDERVRVVPYTDLFRAPLGKSYHQGGPIWSDWPNAGFARHHTHGRRCDMPPPHQDPTAQLTDGNLFWGGAICHHFGHQIMDFSMRILGSCAAHPSASLLFSRLPGAPIPPFFKSILDWFEVEPARVRVIDAPIRAQTLHIVPQAEQTHRGTEPAGVVGPSAAYLDLMDRFIAQKRLPLGTETRPVFLTRAGVQLPLAGEAYIAWAAQQCGAIVVRPEQLPLAEQMALILAARTLIITEGSAFHLLSLAGRQFHTLDVLVRRPSQQTANAALTPRCNALAYVDLLDGCLCGLTPKGRPFEHGGLPIPGERQVIERFGRHGVDLRRVWSHDDFADAVERDVRLWVRHRLRRAVTSHPDAAAFVDATIDRALAVRPRLAAHVRAAVRNAAASLDTAPIQLPALRPTHSATLRRAITRRLAPTRPRYPAPARVR